ncbi:MAG: murein L,D-transpeptidase catalytic domain family protein, partial [Marinobacter sp.]|uniref:murein L,D-transpeptidase catalytic domain family protein n=1 Tax=Marinobacter sp. TaxID=50741 RepID=UPI0029C54C60
MPKHHNRRVFSLFSGLAISLAITLPAQAQSLDDQLLARLASVAPKLNPEVLEAAFKATHCAIANGVAMPERLAVIDFSLHSSQERMWIFDLEQGDLLLRDLVAHGRNSGNEAATTFSNIEGSYQSSLGLFKASESYRGMHGYSLRLDGLEPGINDLARQRAIVIHGADYVNSNWVDQYGRIGRSHGCPAVDQKVVQTVVDNLKGGQLVFKYYPDQ